MTGRISKSMAGLILIFSSPSPPGVTQQVQLRESWEIQIRLTNLGRRGQRHWGPFILLEFIEAGDSAHCSSRGALEEYNHRLIVSQMNDIRDREYITYSAASIARRYYVKTSHGF
jgi:hypothetical protein